MFHFFPLDCHFVLRTIYLPALFQALTTCWETMHFARSTRITNCSWSVNSVGSMYGTFPWPVNPVGAGNFFKISDLNQIFCKPRRGRLHGGATPSCSYFQTKKCLFCSIDSQWILERVMIFQGCPIKGKLTTVYHHGWSNLLHLFRPWFFSFHSNSLDIKALYHWQGVAFTGSFLCKYAKHFKGERSLRRHICPVTYVSLACHLLVDWGVVGGCCFLIGPYEVTWKNPTSNMQMRSCDSPKK